MKGIISTVSTVDTILVCMDSHMLGAYNSSQCINRSPRLTSDTEMSPTPKTDDSEKRVLAKVKHENFCDACHPSK